MALRPWLAALLAFGLAACGANGGAGRADFAGADGAEDVASTSDGGGSPDAAAGDTGVGLDAADAAPADALGVADALVDPLADAVGDAAADVPVDSGADSVGDAAGDGGGDAVGPDVLVAPGALAGACAPAERLGGFVVGIYAAYSAVDGKVADGIVPASVPDLETTEGTCRLLRRRSLACEPPCDSAHTCDTTGACVPFPLQQDLGTVRVHGLVQSVSMLPLQPGNVYFDTSLPHPPCAAGAPVLLTTDAAGFVGALTLHGDCAAPLALLTRDWVVARGTPLVVEWTPPPEGARTEVALRLNIDQHGRSPVTVTCRFPDSGRAEVPAAMIDALFDAGVSGFPNAALVRQTADSARVAAGCVDFLVLASATPRVDVRR